MRLIPISRLEVNRAMPIFLRSSVLAARLNQDFDAAISLTADRIVAPIRILVWGDRSSFSVTFDRRGDWYEVLPYEPGLYSFSPRFH
jgi:hypothetical protein